MTSRCFIFKNKRFSSHAIVSRVPSIISMFRLKLTLLSLLPPILLTLLSTKKTTHKCSVGEIIQLRVTIPCDERM